MKRSITLPTAIALYIGAVVGTGILIIPALAAETAGPASLVAWTLMGLAALPFAATFGILSARYPHAGGVSNFVTLAFGRMAGIATGWLFLASVSIGASITAMTGASYLNHAVPLTPMQRMLTGLMVLLVAIILNYFGIRLSSRVQMALSYSIVAILVVAVLVALPRMTGAHFQPFMPHGWISIGLTGTMIFWSFLGWEAVSHLAEEFENPQRDFPRSIGISVGLVSLLYWLVALVTVGTGAYGATYGMASLAAIVGEALGVSAGLVIALMGIIICAAVLNTYVASASRLAYALARDGALPRWMNRTHAVSGTPVPALLVMGTAILLVYFIVTALQLDMGQVLQLPNATFIALYLIGAAAAFRLFYQEAGWRLVAAVTLFVNLVLFLFLGWLMLYPPLIMIAGICCSRLISQSKATPQLPRRQAR